VKVTSTLSPLRSVNTFSLKNPGMVSDSNVAKITGIEPSGFVSFTSTESNLLKVFSFLSSIVTASLLAGEFGML
jgi:hypothetical protein